MADRCLEGKKVLMFGPKFFGYREVIAQQIRDQGAEVDLFDERPNNGAFCKIMLRYDIPFYRPITRKYYNHIINQTKPKQYDYIFIIKSEAINQKIFSDLKAAFPKAQFVLYLWDSVDNVPGGKEKIKMYDRVLTFDHVDAKEYGIIHRPLFYRSEFSEKYENKQDYKFEVAFIGTAHSIRPRIIKQLEQQCQKRGKEVYKYLFLPHPIVFLYNKISNKAYQGITKAEIHFEPISPEKINEIYKESKCILDVEHSAQRGLTMRTIEMIGVGKKLITTNKGIKDYDFYNADNICIIDRENPVVNEEFWTSSYKEISPEILNRYSIERFVKDIFSVKE